MTAIKSMTGYGSCEHLGETGLFRVFLKSVNRKGLDLHLNLADSLREFENSVREWISESLHRGTLSISVEYQSAELGRAITLDEAAWEKSVTILERAQEISGWSLQDVALILGSPLGKIGLFSSPATKKDLTKLGKELKEAIFKALEQFHHFRDKEGLALKLVMQGLLKELADLVQTVEAQVDGSVKRQLEKWTQRLKQLEVYKEGDPHRWYMEIALLADRTDIREEIDRLKTHMAHFHDLLTKGPFPIGRKLDFLTQEMMREANTLMSKSQDTGLTALGIELKSTIERLREQLQNVE